jgi:hypothetical protein
MKHHMRACAMAAVVGFAILVVFFTSGRSRMATDAASAVAYVEARGGKIHPGDTVECPDYVVLKGAEFDGSVVDVLNRFSLVGALRVEKTQLLPTDIARLQTKLAIKYIDLIGPDVDDEMLTAIPFFPDLKECKLESDRVTDDGIASLARFPKLSALRITGKKVQGRFLTEFDRHALTALWLANTSTDDTALERIGKHRDLTTLLLGNTLITDAGLGPLSKLPILTYLRLNDTRIEGSGLKNLAKCERLKTIDLAGTRVALNDVLVLESLARLEEVHLENTRVSVREADWFGARLPVRGARDEILWLEGRGGRYSIDSTAGKLDLQCGSSEFKDEDLACLSSLLTDATVIDFSRCGIGDSGAEQIGRVAQRCEALRLVGTGVSDVGLSALGGLSELKVVDVSMTAVTEDGAARFRANNPRVDIVR